MVKRLLAVTLLLTLFTSLAPAGMVILAAGEEDTRLSSLSYTYQGESHVIELTNDDINSSKQESRYEITLPFVTKSFSAAHLPKISADASVSGANLTIIDIAKFPGTAKVTATSANDSNNKRNYYIRFKYAPGGITNVTNLMPGGTRVYKALHDLQPLTLNEMRELYSDMGSTAWMTADTGWEKYNKWSSDLATSAAVIGSTAATNLLPTAAVVPEFLPTGWFYGWFCSKPSASVTGSNYFDGVSRILVAHADRTSYGSTNNMVSFHIDRGATVWYLAKPSPAGTASTTMTAANGWTDYSNDSTKRMYLGDGYDFQKMYSKYYPANTTVTIPNYGASLNRGAAVFVEWDAPTEGNSVDLTSLTVTYNDTPHSIQVVPGQTNYRVVVPSESTPVISATFADATADTAIFQATSLPGNATVYVASGQQMVAYTIELAPLSNDASLKTLNYTHPMMGKQKVELQAGVTTYNVVLPYGISSDVPQVAGEANNANAAIQSVTQATSLRGSASILVVAEDETESNYIINFTVDQSPPVVDHLPGNVTNVKTRFTAYGTPTVFEPVPVSKLDKVYAVSGSRAVPYTKYDSTTGYETAQERIAAATSAGNPYLTADTSKWVFGDRPVTYEYSGIPPANPVNNNSQYVVLEETSSVLVGDNVTKVLTYNDERMSIGTVIDDMYTFTIDKGATVYVTAPLYNNEAYNGNNGRYDSVFHPRGWKSEPDIKSVRGSTVIVADPDSDPDPAKQTQYAVPNGSSIFGVVYSKRFSAGANVIIPNRGTPTNASSGMMVFVVWDQCNSNVMLADLKVNDVPIGNFNKTKTIYDVELPFGTTQIPEISATPDFEGASVQIEDAQSLPGTATVIVTAADGETVGNYTINYTLAAPSNGDINGDGVINISDVVCAAEIAVGYTGYTPEQIERANVSDKSNTTVDIADVILLIEYVTGKIESFQIEQQ